MFVIGIDPGKDGYIAGVDDIHGFVTGRQTPTVKARKGRAKRLYDVGGMRAMLRVWGNVYPRLVVLEKQQVMPGQGVSTSGQIMYGFGLWEGILAGLSLPYHVVHPRTWQKVMHKDAPGGDPKARSVVVAGRLFPGVDLRKGPKCRKPHTGKCDAVLLAYYGLYHVLGAETKGGLANVLQRKT